MRVRAAPAAGIVAIVITAAISHLRVTPYDNFVYLAQAWLHGHSWIDWPGAWIDALPYNNRYYVIEAPLPAVLLLPYVAVAGLQANQTLLSIILCGIAIGAAWELGERFELSRWSNAWICAFLLAGTDLLWCATFGDVWFVEHVGAVAFTMLALAEIAGNRRPWLVALWAACAFESRFSLVLAVPVYFAMLGAPKNWKPAAAQFAVVLVPVALLWIWYNQARWGTWNDIGYSAWYHQDQAGMSTGSPFRLEYFPYQLWSFFVQAPTQLTDFPGLRPEISGVALTWTSPALILALFARSPLRWVIPLWILALLTAAPNFVYYVNGFAQFGMRHALDFEPFLVGLMMLAVRDRFPQWGYVLVAYSCVAGFWGIWYWQTFIRQ